MPCDDITASGALAYRPSDLTLSCIYRKSLDDSKISKKNTANSEQAEILSDRENIAP